MNRLLRLLVDPLRRFNSFFENLRLVQAMHERASGIVHRMDWLFVVLVLVTAAAHFLPKNAWTAGYLNLVLAVLLFVGIFLKLQHGARLCEQCVVEFSVDAPEHAARHRRRFQLFHWAPGMLCLAVVPVLVAPFLPQPWSGAIYLPNPLTLILTTLLARFHSSYEPWCPYCHNGRGGDDEREAAPDPTGGHGRPLPVV